MNKQNTMKLGFLAGAAVLSLAAGSAQAASTNVCTGTAGSSAVASSSTGFIKQGFNQQCSANVMLAYDSDATNIGVCAGSNKGNIKYGGTSTGGAVSSAGAFSSGGTYTANTAGCAP